jgi:hypothetical protein
VATPVARAEASSHNSTRIAKQPFRCATRSVLSRFRVRGLSQPELLGRGVADDLAQAGSARLVDTEH